MNIKLDTGRNKITKKLLIILFASLLFLSACGGISESEVQDEEVADEDYIVYSMNDLKYSVLESWPEEIADENFKYYYPEEGMLMVAYEELDEKISNDKLRG